ncbi:MAG: TetR/AcrR family transcriptional regulator [Rhodospirillaceae bacterium]|nr:TetR/AcrR family transcriptional regulator [Rhodospirillaceae bacterium]
MPPDAPCLDKPACRGRRPDPGKRTAIIDAAFQLFMGQGYGVSMEAIATEAGVSKQTIYNLFSTKEHLFGAVVANRTEILVTTITHTAPDASPRDVLQNLAKEFLALMAGDTIAKVYRMMMSAVIEGGGYSEMCAQFYKNGPEQTTAQFAQYLAHQDEIGRLCIPDSKIAAESFFGMLKGHMLIRNMMGLQDHWDAEILTAKAEYCVGMFLMAHATPST